MDEMSVEEERKVKTAFAEGSENFSEAKLDEVLNDSETAREKAEKHLGGFFEEFRLLWQLLCDYKSGKYVDVPWKFIAAAGFAMLYLLNPFDVIPDLLPLVGYLDDAFIFGLVIAAFKSEIEDYNIWKKDHVFNENELRRKFNFADNKTVPICFYEKFNERRKK